MDKLRTAAIVLIALILICFLVMAVTLFLGKTDLFFLEGGMLVALFIAAFVLIRFKKKKQAEKDVEEA